MSDKVKFAPSDHSQRAAFLNHLVDDLQALQTMLVEGRFETGITRLGAEQEMCLVDPAMRPAMVAGKLLESLSDEHFTTELARYNLELNLDPRELKDNCLSEMEQTLAGFLGRADEAAHPLGASVILTGILPTVRESDVTLENMTPAPRYRALNDALREARGSDFRFYIRGVDELITSHATVLYEACNTSFQVHFQIDPARFASFYNWAQAIAAPILSCAANAPLFLGKRLWRETRIALFHQSTDSRGLQSTHREQRPRVDFGRRWESGSVADYFKDLISHYKVLLTPVIERNSLEELRQGRTPKLVALNLLNGTVYPWNRPCYGITNGRPHIRIESRYLPAGPSVLDEVANAALWLGLMNGMPVDCEDLSPRMPFEQARDNFLSAARTGLGAHLSWLDGQTLTARSLLLNTLLPIARSGLEKASLDSTDIDKYLSVIEQRVASGKTGSQWTLDSVARLQRTVSRDEAIVATTRGIYERQRVGQPVHRWQPCELGETGDWKGHWSRVDQLMSTDLITVQPDEPIKLVRSILLWSRIRHIPVESDDGKLLGMISSETLLGRGDAREMLDSARAAEVMERNPVTVTPDTPIGEALRLMSEQNLTGLPVLENDKLVGIVTERDYLRVVRSLLCANADS